MRRILLSLAALILGISTAINATHGAGAAPAVATSATAATKPVDYYALSDDAFFKRPELDQKISETQFDLPLMEAAVFHQTNLERAKLKLPIFKYGQAMNLMARLHSQEMSDLQYFEHVSPIPANATLGDRLKNAGLVNVAAGENIAVLPAKEMGSGHYVTHPGQGDDVWFDEVTGKRVDYYTYRQIAGDVLTQWMNSPHHRDNIVNKAFVYLGVGIMRGPYDTTRQDSFYFTQNFSSAITKASEDKAKAKLADK